MPIIHRTAISYNSTIDDLTLLYDISYNSSLSLRPLVVLMHGWNDSRTAIVEEWKNRLVTGRRIVCQAVDMRGRSSSDGTADASGREIYDIYDAINHAIANYSIDPYNINIMGYSGGGGNVLKMMCAFPDLFTTATSFFGMSDYGVSSSDGWWYTTAARRAEIQARIGGAPARFRSRYYTRSGLYFISNARYSRCRAYHDEGDAAVPVVNTENIETAVSDMSNWAVNISDATDSTRWLHGYPYTGGGGTPNMNAEPAIFNDINNSSYRNPSIAREGTLLIPGYLITKNFRIWLGDGLWNYATVDYDLNQRSFVIRNARSNRDATFTMLQLNPDRNYYVFFDRDRHLYTSNSSGELSISFNMGNITEILIKPKLKRGKRRRV